jgi:hypothetical protein
MNDMEKLQSLFHTIFDEYRKDCGNFFFSYQIKERSVKTRGQIKNNMGIFLKQNSTF